MRTSARRVSFLFFLIISGIALLTAGCATQGSVKQNGSVVINASSDPVFYVTDFGAIGDGQTLNTRAIQRAVDTCAARGGGVVYVPPGKYVTGPIMLKSNINFHISQGATLLGDTVIADYPGVHGRWEGIDRTVYASMFTGHDLENVSITGRGTLDGRGEVWWKAHEVTSRMRDEAGIEGRAPDNPPGAPLKWPRPRMINLYHSKNILIRDITILNSPSWTIHPVYCQNITVDNVTIIQPYESPNTDGINPDSCSDVRIVNCYVDVGDDCVTIKSGYNEYGRQAGVPCENISVTNCTFAHGRGGVVVGSEMSGDVRDITVSNCVFDGTLRGLRIKTARGRGGVVENFRASNLVMRNIMDAAFSITTSYGGRSDQIPPVTDETPRIRHIHWGDVIVMDTDKTADIGGLPEMPLEDFSLTNVDVVSANSGIHIRQAQHVLLQNVTVNARYTPALMAQDITDLELDRFTTRTPGKAYPVIQFDHVDDGWVQNSTAPEGTGTFLELVGTTNRNLRMTNNRLEKAARSKEIVEEPTRFIQAPTAVQNTLRQELGSNFTVEEIQRDQEGGRLVYDVEATVEGKTVDLTIAEDGTLLERRD